MGAVSQYRFSRIYSSGHAEHGTDRDYLLNPVTPNKKKTTIVITQTISYITRASGEPQVLLLGGDADRIRFRHGRDHWFYDFFHFFSFPTSYMFPLAFLTCWDCGSFCPKWRRSGRTWAGRLAPSASSPAWAGGVLEGSPWVLEDGTPPR